MADYDKKLDEILDQLQVETIHRFSTTSFESVLKKYVPSREKAKQAIIDLFLEIVDSFEIYPGHGNKHQYIDVAELRQKIKEGSHD